MRMDDSASGVGLGNGVGFGVAVAGGDGSLVTGLASGPDGAGETFSFSGVDSKVMMGVGDGFSIMGGAGEEDTMSRSGSVGWEASG